MSNYLRAIILSAALLSGCSDTTVTFKGKVYYGSESSGGGILVHGALGGAKVKEVDHTTVTDAASDGSYVLKIEVPRILGYSRSETYTLEAWGDVPTSYNPSVTTTANERISINARPGDTVSARNFLLYRHDEESD
ncbi:MAG: hypothetical protein ABIJ15_03520 [bacterium]